MIPSSPIQPAMCASYLDDMNRAHQRGATSVLAGDKAFGPLDEIDAIRLRRKLRRGHTIACVGLGAIVDPKFYALSGFVGAGLVFAGTTGTCGMARLLALAPWNRAAQASLDLQ